jgi:hypothetical protein
MSLHPTIQALRPYLNAWGMDHQDEVLAAIHQAPPPGLIFPPSHLTRAQAARVLERPLTTVMWQAKPGRPLQAETWHGTPMIPAWRVMLELAKRMENHA